MIAEEHLFCKPIVFPRTCALEKHFARSERRIVRQGRTTEAQSEAGRPWPPGRSFGISRMTALLKKDAKHLF
jgi:hypothetical protein